MYGTAVICLCVATIGTYRNSRPRLSDLALANIEALADEEQYVSIPCVIEEECSCEYNVILADGTKGTRIDYGMRHKDSH